AEASAAPAGLFATAETRALKTETAIDALRKKFGAAAVIAGRALPSPLGGEGGRRRRSDEGVPSVSGSTKDPLS
ncbi:MAG TPA: hypothetical protein VLZ51_10835, partial [Brevundimonas sp.]|nr:hypothetical protein [Brevundimonas sp.]